MTESLDEYKVDAVVSAPDQTVVLPGSVLLSLREAKGLSLNDVAQSLKFSIRQIEALERDDYQSLQGATFIRGFIRAYARLLRTPPEPLLSRLDQAIPVAETEIVVPANMGEATPRPFVDRYQRVIIAVLFLAVAAAIGSYLWTREEAASEAAKPAADNTPAVVAQQATTPVTEAAATSGPAPLPPTTTLPVAAETPAAVPGEKQIVLEFDGVSWVEIKDAAQRVVLTGEFQAGARQVAVGRPPFQIWIGMAPNVRVSYGEQKVDLVPFSRDQIARLTLE